MIRLNKPYATKKGLTNIKKAIREGRLSGNGYFTKKSSSLLEKYLNTECTALITHSCTASLEMAALLIEIKEGDEIIMPSYTFVSTANAFVLRGGVPVFVDIKKDTLNLNEDLIEDAITHKTKAIVVVHYAGVSCNMEKISNIAKRNKLALIEDAAQALGSEYKNRKLGTFGDLSAISFHETKNIISGEGGALIINNKKYLKRAEIIWEKGTNRSLFFKGMVDKYTWVDIGSSYLPSELVSAYLFSQIEQIDKINKLRMAAWNYYYKLFTKNLEEGLYKIPFIPKDCIHNAHMFYIILRNQSERDQLIDKMKKNNINPVFHYIPLHSSPAGKQYGRKGSSMINSNNISKQILRLPLYPHIGKRKIKLIHSKVIGFLKE